MSGKSTLDLNRFYPTGSLEIIGITEEKQKIKIRLKSITSSCRCPACNQITDRYHGTYVRKVQDLPILGKQVELLINAHEYQCLNPDCKAVTIAETFDGFLNYYSRMTERCAAFITMLALETSCEGCARICNAMGIRTSGDSVIRLLMTQYEKQKPSVCGDIIGVDDFAYKKRNTYGTIIVDEKTHAPVKLLDGRDGASLRQWLHENQHIKAVTRDRASAYAKVISEELPDVMQIADRFHLHQNLLEAVKGALNHTVPATVTIKHESQTAALPESTGKKNGRGCG